ncbi:MAG: LPS-assembly protein LptD, partial [Brevundimonas sp.]
MRSRLRTGAALSTLAMAFAAGAAFAQTSPPDANDGLGDGGVYVDAQSATRQGDVVTAQGGADGADRALVRARGYTLRANQIGYDLGSGVASASGQAEIVSPNGDVAYASQLRTDPDLQVGVAVDFATRLENGASLMAATAVRRGETANELNYALFTPCPICDEKGNPKTPSISIQAEKVVQDEELRAILYRNAVFKIGGVPVLYLPFFSHPDPTVERASGLLVPLINYDDGRGLSVETPYLHVVSPSEDWLISPQFNGRVAPFLNLQWRRRFDDGAVELRGGYTYERPFGDYDADDDGLPDISLDRESRSYVLGWGRFDPDGPWRWGFTAERTSDKTLFDRYDILSPYHDNGLYYGDQRRLISQLYA